MIKHPKELGFKLGLKIRIGEPAEIIDPDASTAKKVVYVALLSENGRSLKKGDALKIGQTGVTLRQRWERTLGICRRKKLRPNEEEDRRIFLERTNGKEISVWMREAGEIEVPYAKGLTQNFFSTRWAEEEFLEEYYQ